MLGYLLEWHAKKAESNVRKHGVTFDEASTVFPDPLDLSQVGHATGAEAL